ncbi:MAG: exodeoxyribonuclease VII small subunit [Saprospiraceae bacterium]
MKKDNLNYDTAYAELTQILEQLQSNEVGLEELSIKLQRAAELTDFCKKRLRDIEAKVEKLKPSL